MPRQCQAVRASRVGSEQHSNKRAAPGCAWLRLAPVSLEPPPLPPPARSAPPLLLSNAESERREPDARPARGPRRQTLMVAGLPGPGGAGWAPSFAARACPSGARQWGCGLAKGLASACLHLAPRGAARRKWRRQGAPERPRHWGHWGLLGPGGRRLISTRQTFMRGTKSGGARLACRPRGSPRGRRIFMAVLCRRPSPRSPRPDKHSSTSR